MTQTRVVPCVLWCALTLGSACVPQGAIDDGGLLEGSGSGPPTGVPTLLDFDNHPGWRNPNCDRCHQLPAPRHTVTDRAICAMCHGANGACVTDAGVTPHRPTDACASCHVDRATGLPGNHGFTSSVSCANCHFRGLGQSTCAPIAVLTDAGLASSDGGIPTLSNALVPGCYGFPQQPFAPTNSVPDGEEWNTRLHAGDLAVDFTLQDTNGTPRRLSNLLAQGPVWLQTGSYSCPVYQNAVRGALNPLTQASNAFGRYVDQVQFVHVYVVEAHPRSPPDWSPYNSTRQFQWSTVAQPTTAAQRLDNARLMTPRVQGVTTYLLDSLDASGGANAVWCTYGTCPSCSWLIGRDGVIRAAFRTPENMSELVTTLDAFLATQR